MRTYEEGEVIFELGHITARAQLLDDGRMGMSFESNRLMVANISPEALIMFRNNVSQYLIDLGYE